MAVSTTSVRISMGAWEGALQKAYRQTIAVIGDLNVVSEVLLAPEISSTSATESNTCIQWVQYREDSHSPLADSKCCKCYDYPIDKRSFTHTNDQAKSMPKNAQCHPSPSLPVRL